MDEDILAKIKMYEAAIEELKSNAAAPLRQRYNELLGELKLISIQLDDLGQKPPSTPCNSCEKSIHLDWICGRCKAGATIQNKP